MTECSERHFTKGKVYYYEIFGISSAYRVGTFSIKKTTFFTSLPISSPIAMSAIPITAAACFDNFPSFFSFSFLSFFLSFLSSIKVFEDRFEINLENNRRSRIILLYDSYSMSHTVGLKILATNTILLSYPLLLPLEVLSRYATIVEF